MPPKPTTTRLTVRNNQRGLQLVEFLAESLNVSKRRAKAALDRRDVFVNSRRVWIATHVLRTGDDVEIIGHGTVTNWNANGNTAAHSAPTAIYSDRHLAIVNKQPGILSCGPHSAETGARSALGAAAARAVHRLDKDTSGCLLLALDQETWDQLVALFTKHAVRKQYHAIVAGRVGQDHTIRRPLEGRSAATRVHVLASSPTASHLLLNIETGRTHQIRRHLSGIGHHVVGDRNYAPSAQGCPALRAAPRQMLHASRIEFRHPSVAKNVVASAPLPYDFRTMLKTLRLK